MSRPPPTSTLFPYTTLFRSFEPLTPHNFSFNSTLGWCPTCEGLGTQLGANPAALLRSTNFTLRQGALALWPDRKSTRLNSSHTVISYAVFCLKKKNTQ